MKYRLSPRDFPRAQVIFHHIPRVESQYSHSQLPLEVNIGFVSCEYFLVLSILDVNIFSYWGFLASGGPNTRKYCLVEVYRSIVTVIFQYSIIC